MIGLLARRRQTLLLIAGLAGYALVWEIIGQTGILGSSWPSLSSVLATATSTRYFGVLLRATSQTTGEALIGYLIGCSIAAALASLTVLVPPLARSISRLAAFANALPPIILGPLLLATVARDQAPIVLSALIVAFGVFVPLVAGLYATHQAHEDLFEALGASKMEHLLRLQVPTSIPYFVDGLKMAAPAAILGAIIAEWFGAERGIGPIFVAAMQNYQIEMLWAAALFAAIASMLFYGLLSVAERLVQERFL